MRSTAAIFYAPKHFLQTDNSDARKMELLEEFKGEGLKKFEGIVGIMWEYLRRLSDLRTREICKYKWKICKVC